MRWALVAFLASVHVFGSGCAAPEGEARQFREADFWLGIQPIPPPDRDGPEDPAWRRVALPDAWNDRRRLTATQGWYRFEFDLAESPSQLQAVFLPRASLGCQIFVNGVMVGESGDFAPSFSRNVWFSVYAGIPNRLLHAGVNRLDVRLGVTYGSPGALAPVWVGPDRELRSSFRMAEFLGRTATRATHALLFLVAIVALSRARSERPEDAGVGLLAFAVIAFNLASVGILFPESHLPGRSLEWLATVALSLCTALASAGMRRFLGRRRRWLELASAIWLVVFGIALATVPYPDFIPVVRLGFLPGILLAIDVFASALQALWRGSMEPRAPVAALTLGVPALFVVERSFDITVGHGLGLATVWTGLAAVSLAWFLLARTTRSMSEAAALDRELVEQRAKEAARARVEALEREQAVARERERIMSDMHDGTAGQLVSAISLARSRDPDPKQLATMLQEALEDLRMTIEALDPGDNTLGATLGLLRAPIGRRLEQQGVELDWKVGDVDSVHLSSTDARHVMRLVQEAAGNALRHADASRVTIEAGPSANADLVRVCIRDDGKGGVHVREGGRGLRNMQKRADELGADLAITSDATGTRVELLLVAAEPG